MAKFPITKTTRTLPGTSPGVRSTISTNQAAGAVGGAVGGALLAGGGIAVAEMNRREVERETKQLAIEKVRANNRKLMDDNNSAIVDRLRGEARNTITAFSVNAKSGEVEPEVVRVAEELDSRIAEFDFSPEEAERQRIKSEDFSVLEAGKGLVADTRKLKAETIANQTERLTEVMASGTDAQKAVQVRDFTSSMRAVGMSAGEIFTAIKAGEQAGGRVSEDRLINGVHAAIQAGEKSGDFTTAEALADDSAIPEDKQTTLRNTIRANKSVFKSKQTAAHEANTVDIALQIADGRNVDDPSTPQVTVPMINDALRANEITLAQRDNLVKRLETPNIKTIRETQSKLYTMSLGIWKGNVTKAQFDKELNAKSSSLDDGAYQTLSKSAADTLKASQAESLSRVNGEIIDLIVDFKDDKGFAAFLDTKTENMDELASKLFRTDANDVRQLQFWSTQRYNAEARQWVTDNPDKTGKDFDIFAEQLKHVYWDRSIKEIEVLKYKRASELKCDSGPKKGDKRVVQGVTYISDGKGNWTSK